MNEKLTKILQALVALAYKIDMLHEEIKSLQNNPVKTNPKPNNTIETQNDKPPLCQNCSIPMKLCEGKYGPFYGCPNYPNCKYVVKIL